VPWLYPWQPENSGAAIIAEILPAVKEFRKIG